MEEQNICRRCNVFKPKSQISKHGVCYECLVKAAREAARERKECSKK